ncbi:MAG: hypothetical protein GY940_07635, partial [bacterium]|nr:hypothetical protein [bacterium]
MKITQRKGYNSQPFFVPNSSLLLYSSAEGQQTDIYRYDVKSQKTTRLTSTPESEYSPTPMPGGQHFSVIQLINSEGPLKGAQPLRAFPFKGGDSIRLYYEKDKKVGYHAWIDKDRVAMFILGSPNTLEMFNLKSEQTRIAAGNIGRSLYKVPGKDAVSFIHYKGSKDGVIKSVDAGTLKVTPLVPMKKGNGYYTWTPGGALLMGVGSELF